MSDQCPQWPWPNYNVPDETLQAFKEAYQHAKAMLGDGSACEFPMPSSPDDWHDLTEDPAFVKVSL